MPTDQELSNIVASAHACRQHHTDPTTHTYNLVLGTYTVGEFKCDDCGDASASFRCRQCGSLYFRETRCPSCGNNNWEVRS